MRHRIPRCGLLCCILFLSPGLGRSQNSALPKVARWPGDRQAAIVLTFDDALPSHLENAAPILRKHGLHGTFFVTTSSRTWLGRAAEWRRLAGEGNEVGGHTVTHPCLLERIQPHAQS